MRKIVLFYKLGADAPFWKIRTPHVSPDEIDTEALGAAQPRCERGMRVTVDGEPWGTVESVARIGASTRWRIALFEEGVAEALADLDRTLEANALADDGDVDGETPTGDGVQDDDAGAQAKNGADAPLADVDKALAKRKRKRKPKAGGGEK